MKAILRSVGAGTEAVHLAIPIAGDGSNKTDWIVKHYQFGRVRAVRPDRQNKALVQNDKDLQSIEVVMIVSLLYAVYLLFLNS